LRGTPALRRRTKQSRDCHTPQKYRGVRSDEQGVIARKRRVLFRHCVCPPPRLPTPMMPLGHWWAGWREEPFDELRAGIERRGNPTKLLQTIEGSIGSSLRGAQATRQSRFNYIFLWVEHAPHSAVSTTTLAPGGPRITRLRSDRFSGAHFVRLPACGGLSGLSLASSGRPQVSLCPTRRILKTNNKLFVFLKTDG